MEKGRTMPVREGAKRPLVGVIDDGTKTVRFVIYEAERSDELVAYQMDKTEVQPHEGWMEQDPLEIMHHIKLCAENAIDQLTELGYSKDDIVTLGITNQRETTIAWDKYTGEPLHPAIAWNDIRTDSTVDAILAKIPDRNKNYFKNICGLPISPYFSALKMRWMKDNIKAVRRASRDKRLLFGTVDTWIIWNMTGGPHGGLHITDVTNASRTLLMNLETLNWDPILCRLFGIHRDTLPTIHSSSEVYGTVKDGSLLDGIRISGILGNQQSALVGHNCLQAGQAKNTYRSGCFLLYNTGTRRVQSTHGLITTVAYKLGPDTPAVYALEGSIAVAGGAMKFLRDNLRLIKDVVQDTEHIAGQVFSTGDVYFVPAFSGLYAPYWRKDARGIICGLTAFTTKNHIIRAALEAVCFQTRDILEAMNKDCGMPLAKLHVDGRMTSNDLLMQLQADLIGIPVLRAQAWDMSTLGVAVVAGGAAGVWSDAWRTHDTPNDTFLPTTTDDDRDARYTKWKMAVQRSLGWATTKKSFTMTGQAKRKTSMMTQQSLDVQSLPDSRKNSLFDNHTLNLLDVKVDKNFDEGVNSYVEELLQYSARKFSIFVPVKKLKTEHTILDDIDYFMSKKECDYGMCECCPIEKKVQTNWESIEEIIENDPEIIFDCDDNPIVVEPVRSSEPIFLTSAISMGAATLSKKINFDKLPALFKSIYNKISSPMT
ncbi:glycerol kinase-like isoform X2 [Helicoverpa zea]|uniref:glycerol kinase-like isoform X1 n=2 Tax=Helicoverpa zea TaxID=7113 RepID=UPI001F5A34C3|nr:glycerol kinase-like isoform X1 [Helicoverpa zea]XP_047037988.1 glycerol kinase-like isoform X2 [Helicoverpa zea]